MLFLIKSLDVSHELTALPAKTCMFHTALRCCEVPVGSGHCSILRVGGSEQPLLLHCALELQLWHSETSRYTQ